MRTPYRVTLFESSQTSSDGAATDASDWATSSHPYTVSSNTELARGRAGFESRAGFAAVVQTRKARMKTRGLYRSQTP